MNTTVKKPFVLLDPALLKPAIVSSFAKLSPRVQWRNPVMFVVYIGSILTTLLGLQALQGNSDTPASFIFAVSMWLWFTVLFANFAESLAEGRSKAQAASLRGLKKSTWAKKLQQPHHGATWLPEQAENLRKGDVVLIEAHDLVPLTPLFRATFMLLTGGSSRLRSVTDLLAAARQGPDRVTYASLGNGHASQLAVEVFARAAGLRMQHVPFKDAGALFTAVASGDVDFTAFSINSVAGLVASGKLRPLAVVARGARPRRAGRLRDHAVNAARPARAHCD